MSQAEDPAPGRTGAAAARAGGTVLVTAPPQAPAEAEVAAGSAAASTAVAAGAAGDTPARRRRWIFPLGNRPPLTGIRAIGITVVLVFHSNFKTLPGAWVALGVFFTLSGFLITAMLANEQRRTGGISLKKFYARRGARLLPPLALTLGLLAILAAVTTVPNVRQALWGDSAAAGLYYADYRSALGHEPAVGYLGQCWSLSVEEQFYVIWAVVMFVVLGLGRRRLAYTIAVTGIVACTVNRLWVVLGAQHYNHVISARAYYAFDTRADALFIGCLLGLLATDGFLEGWGRRAKSVLTALAVASTGAMIYILLTVRLDARSLPLWWLTVSELASVVIIAYFVVKPQGIGSRVIGLGVLVFIGNLSYTLYLIHWPVYVMISPWGPFGINWPYWDMMLLRYAIIIPIVLLSWFLMERPLMRWRRKTL